MLKSKEVVLVDYLRTPFSRSNPDQPERDVFYQISADNLLALVIKEVVARAKFDPNDIDELIVGCANQAKENFAYGGRHNLFLAELPETVGTMAVDRQCGSSMASVHIGTMEILTGNSDIVIAGGMEHLTRVPRETEFTPKKHELENEELYPALAKYNLKTGFTMLQTAQLLWEQNTDITREDMDSWGLLSHERAIKARDEGFFDDELLPIEVILSDGTKKLIEYDQSIRGGSNMETMSKLRPYSKGYQKEPQITAGNSSPLNAGASCCILMSENRADELNIKPLAKIKSISWAGVNPGVMGQAPVPASKKALKKAGLKAEDIDFWEINEAFAIVTLYAKKMLNIPEEKINVKGGAIALGHPLGATGLRLVGTLARILHSEGGNLGLATACVGGGQGVTTIIEKV